MWSTATHSKASSTFASMLPREVMQPCLPLQMKCRTGLMRLPLIHKDDTLVAVRQCGAFSTFPSIKDPLVKTLLYSEVPRHFRWDASQKVWQIRKKGVPLADFPGYVTDNALGRVCILTTENHSTCASCCTMFEDQYHLKISKLLLLDMRMVTSLKLSHAALTLGMPSPGTAGR
ncbi:hypothetical protein TNCT_278741 [Trichonephila clavata]|uniref:Uncharacterized protein n=1 Tax=Trichonephila clavata TaxID=2740835 RepID=A0A8X6KIU1_TRICU|nr:hypothetical protein TNCT_278741 [Trichonephila clavata]